MIQEQKQALHIENGKSFSRSEANKMKDVGMTIK